MIDTTKLPYVPPNILQKVTLQTEGAALLGSVVDNLNLGGIDATPQVVDYRDFDDSDSFEFKWE